MACRTLVLCYGNPARQDDGLGPALAAALADWPRENVTVEADYQLTVEDAAAAAEHQVVVFVDAARSGPEPFALTRVAPEAEVAFSSHTVSPGAVLALAQSCFGAAPAGYALGIRGYAFDTFAEELSDRARSNLDAARRFLEPMLSSADPARWDGQATGAGHPVESL